jgi:DNA-binding SARP family transcriptional activator/tetratricopeptide (TPR) repeat protein
MSEDAGVSFNILGALECWSNGRQVPLGGPLQERMVVTLLLEANRVIPLSRLVETVWEGVAPATAVHQIRKMAWDLRKRIPGGADVLQTGGLGYQAVVSEEQLDLSLFNVRLRRARAAAAAGLRENAVEQLRAALDLWRGPLLSGGGGTVLEAAATELGEVRGAATEELIGLRLDLGAGSELVGELRRLVAEYPLRERLRGQLMLALYRSARQAEALEEYVKIRELLSDEVGIDPCAELVQLHGDILRGSPALSVPAAGPVVPVEIAPHRPQRQQNADAPSSLPRFLPDFTGREKEVADLVALAQPGPQMKIISLEGMGGSGKTALAVRVAHTLAEQYPDGPLWVDLSGFTPGQSALDPAVALDVLLRTLGVPGDRIPDGLLNRIALWRVTTAQRRLLIVLDNASESEQIHPLLPAAPECLVLITSRVRLFDVDGAQVVPVDVLTPEDSTRLLVQVLGEERVAAEPEAALQLIELCGRLPLALRIAAGRLAARPRWSLANMGDRLGLQTRRLQELRGGNRGVAACISLSYLAIGADARVAFRRLGALPVHDFDAHGAAALMGVTVDEAVEQLEHLVDVNLLGQHADDRYTFHDLVRDYALEIGEPWRSTADRRALVRLMDHYLQTLMAATNRLYPGLLPQGQDLGGASAGGPDFPDNAAALAWMERERSNLSAVVRLSRDAGMYRHAVQLPRYLNDHLQLNGYNQESLALDEIAIEAAGKLGDPQQLRSATANVAVALWGLGCFREGLVYAERSLDIAVVLGDPAEESSSLLRIGSFHNALGEFDKALHCLDRALSMTREHGTLRELGSTQVAISSAAGYLGDYERSAAAAREAIAIHRQLEHRTGEVLALVNLANAEIGQGQPEAALIRLTEAWSLGQLRGAGARNALVAARLAEVQLLLGDVKEARRHIDLIRDELGTRSNASVTVRLRNTLGAVHRCSGEYPQARQYLRDALAQAESMGFRIGAAEALQGLSLVADATGDTAVAAEQRERAQELFDAMGVRVGHIRLH